MTLVRVHSGMSHKHETASVASCALDNVPLLTAQEDQILTSPNMSRTFFAHKTVVFNSIEAPRTSDSDAPFWKPCHTPFSRCLVTSATTAARCQKKAGTRTHPSRDGAPRIASMRPISMAHGGGASRAANLHDGVSRRNSTPWLFVYVPSYAYCVRVGWPPHHFYLPTKPH